MQYALGFATRQGMAILSDTGERITIPKVKIGNMFQPDPDAFDALFLQRLTPEDTVLSPSGPNYTYLSGAFARGARVFWLHAALLKDVRKVPEELQSRFAENPDQFYAFQPQNERVAALALRTRQLIAIERQRTADGNSQSQMLRRERDFFRFHRPDPEVWITRQTETEERKFALKLSRTGVKLDPEQRKTLRAGIRERMVRLYEHYYAKKPESKEEQKSTLRAAEELVRDRMEWFGADILESVYEKEVEDILRSMPENTLFDGLLSGGTVKVRAEMLTLLRNPLLYPNAAALHAYADMGVTDGQARRRTHGQATGGNPEFRRVLCFDFAEKYWQNDTVGFFRDLYYATKEMQTATYWDLITLTADVFATLGRSVSDDEEEVEEQAGNGNGKKARAATPAVIRTLAERLQRLEHLDIIQRSERVRSAIARVIEHPSAEELWRIFSRSPRASGLNLQMTPKRIEAQVKRFLGVTLLDAVYYRWHTQLGFPQPIKDDNIFVRRWRQVNGRTDGVPAAYDHQVVLAWVRREAASRSSRVTIPDEVRVKFIPPKSRPGAKAAAETSP